MNLTWPANATKPIASLTGHKDRVVALAFSPDRCFLASAAHDGTCRVWDVAHSKAREPAVIYKPG